MTEHFWHYLIIFLLLGGTFIYKFRNQFSFKLFFVVLLVGLSFHNLFLHFDSKVVDLLTEQTHQCCVLPVAVKTEEVHFIADKTNAESYLIFTDKNYYPVSFSFYYSRPPPSFS